MSLGQQYFRIRASDIAEVWRPEGSATPPVMQKSVLGHDEDTITMAIEAARTAMGRSEISMSQVGGLWLGTESKPYAVKPSATLVAAALGAKGEILAADVEFNTFASPAPFGCKKMRDVYIVGLGFAPVAEHWRLSLRGLGARAICAALDDAGLEPMRWHGCVIVTDGPGSWGSRLSVEHAAQTLQ